MTVCQSLWREIFFENEKKILLILCWHKEYQPNSRGRKKEMEITSGKKWNSLKSTIFLLQNQRMAISSRYWYRLPTRNPHQLTSQRSWMQKREKNVLTSKKCRETKNRSRKNQLIHYELFVCLSQSNLVLCLFNKKIYCLFSLPLDLFLFGCKHRDCFSLKVLLCLYLTRMTHS